MKLRTEGTDDGGGLKPEDQDEAVSMVAEGDAEIPASFMRAMEDFKAGRVVDAETALNEPPRKA